MVKTERQPAPRAGIRWFKCDDCEATWQSATRDAQSPSGEHCPVCSDMTPPHMNHIVPGVFFNEYGGINPREVWHQYRATKE